jgi:hypothetical protein
LHYTSGTLVPDGFGYIVFERPGLWPLALLLAGVAFFLGRRIYALPSEAPSHFRILPLLRWAVVLVLCLSILGPVWRRPARPDDAGPIAVLIDTSLSMGVRDTQRPPADRLRLAQSLGRWQDPAAETRRNLVELTDQLAAAVSQTARLREEAEFLDLSRRDPRDARARLVESRTELARLIARLAAAPGFPDTARARLASIDTGPESASASWAADARATLASLRQSLDQAHDAALNALLESDPRARDAAQAMLLPSRLDLAADLLGQLLARLPRGAPVRLASFDEGLRGVPGNGFAGLAANGLRTDLSAAFVTASAARPLSAILLLTDGRSTSPPVPAPAVPVYALLVAPEAPPPGVRISDFSSPNTLVAGQSARLSIALDPVAISGVASLRLLAVGQTQLRDIAVSPGRSAVVEFDLLAERPGDLPLELTLRQPDGAAPSPEIRFHRVVRVTPRAAEVLLVSRLRPWDARRLRDALTKTPWLGVVDSDPDNPELPSLLLRAAGVVLADLAPSDLSPAARVALDESVRRRGRAVLLLPGPENLPARWLGDPDLAAYTPAESATWRVSSAPQGSFIATPTTDAAFLGSRRIWTQRAPLFRMLALGQVKPAAAPLLIETSSQLPLLTEQPLGAGRVLFLATDQAWRWQPGTSGAFPDFFPALLARLVEPPFAATDAGTSIDAIPTEAGGFTIRLRRLGSDSLPLPGPPPVLSLKLDGHTLAETSPAPTAPGRYLATVPPQPPGLYTLQLRDSELPRIALHFGDSGQLELADLSADRPALTRLTRSRVYTESQLDSLATELTTQLRSGPPVVSRRLWDSPALALALIALLTAEWALRKHWGLS